MKGFDPKFADLPDYIIGITKEIWEDRGIATLHRYYAPEIVVRTPMGVSRGNQGVIAATMATCHEFPDRALYADDVIWSGDAETGFLSSHRLLTTATHARDGQFGPATGRRFRVYVIADCAARNGMIDDEWLVRDYGGIVRQLGLEPRAFAASLIAAGDESGSVPRPFTPDRDIAGPYRGAGNDNDWGARYADGLNRIMAADFNHVLTGYDRAVQGHYPGAAEALGRDEVAGLLAGPQIRLPVGRVPHPPPDRHGGRRPQPPRGVALVARRHP